MSSEIVCDETGYISGYVSRPLSPDERNNRGLGYEVSEWTALNREEGGASRFPLRIEHDQSSPCGRILETTVWHTSDGTPMLGISGMVDLKSATGRRAWNMIKNEKASLSWGVDAFGDEDTTRYKNVLREVSIVRTPAKREACIRVRCSKFYNMAETTKTESATPPAPPAPTGDVQMNEPTQPDFILQTATADPVKLAQITIENYNARTAAEKRAAEFERVAKDNAEKAAAWDRRDAEEKAILLKKQQEELAALLPMLKQHGMDVDEASALQSFSSQPSMLAAMRAIAAKAEEQAKLLEQERAAAKEAQLKFERTSAFLNQLRPGSITETAAAKEPRGTKRPVNDAPKAEPKRAAPIAEKAAEALGLTKLNSAAFSKANETVLPPAKVEDAAPEEEPEINIPNAINERLNCLWEMANNNRIPVRCNADQAAALQTPIAQKSIFGADYVPDAAKLFFFSNQYEMYQLSQRLPFCPWRYNADGSKLIDERDMARRQQQLHSIPWSFQ